LLQIMIVEIIQDWLAGLKIPDHPAEILAITFSLFLLLVVVGFVHYITHWVINSIINPFIKDSSATKWDDELIKHGVIVRCSHFVLAATIHFSSPLLFSGYEKIIAASKTVVNTYLIIIILLVIDSVLNLLREIWDRLPISKRFASKGFVQAAKLVINLIGFIFVLSAILGKSPIVFFSGLGAITAILLLIFKDAILGLVAGFQLSINNMVAVGDWIEMPKRGADGDVVDVSLTTVKIQNWDKTITTIPTYSLISDSFKNWRGMSQSGGRRIKRSINIDLRSIQFADEALLDQFKQIRILKPYLEQKLDDIKKHNSNIEDDLSELINGRRLTNIGTFRAYCVAYLKNNSKIHTKGMTLLVRQLAPTQTGIPIQLYAFTNDTKWVHYEDIQSDIFDHLFSILPEFKLRAFQAPSGSDLDNFLGKIG